ncbi:MAG: PP2C family protein-serine/threonine phosphatase [Oscillatoriaceae cyanobacterium Prado104]|jgi:sigma-B regulation protein RsbU (phosphoserine phosphatase)|nr:PP2C family protein-serine/threonine phosphatase [Oscillatoriaceae cyanobacterium Prado104]
MQRKSLGISLMNRLSYPQKFSTIAFLFAMPLALVTYLLISEINSRIDFAQKEIYGNEYLRPLRQLREYIPQLQFLNYQRLNPDLQESDRGADLEAKIDVGFHELENTDRRLGSVLATSEKFDLIYQDWQNFKLRRRDWSRETYDVIYQRLLTDVNRLSDRVGDTSNLILDPDLDTYYLMDATLLKLPEMQKILSEIRLLSQKITLSSNATAEERAQLIALSGRLRQISRDMAANMEVGFNNNPRGNLRPRLSESLKIFNSQANQLSKNLDKLITTTAFVQYDSYVTESEQVLDASFQLWDETLAELDILLQARIDGFVGRKQSVSIFIVIILAIVIYLFLAFYRAVMRTVFVLDEAAKSMASGNLSDKITLDNRDELGQVVGAFNRIAGALVSANQEITVLNDRLKAENMRMSAELDVTRKIQQMLLPKDRELKEVNGLDIAGFMEPADEVGGDYYDVLQQDGRVKIGIGDVTGHGLESGVLMIMVQTAVRTLLAYDEPDSVRFLSAVNRAIYDNVQRMKSDKNASLALLDYEQGMLKLSGQHEEMIVVRSGGAVERFDTIDLGFPIGLDADIADFVAETIVQLHSGDVVVLYTDGITEAENMDKVLYGLERLIEAIQINRWRSASEIRHAVIDDVRSHIGEQKVFDDITLLVLKQQ